MSDEKEDRAAFEAYLAANPMATYWSTWQAGRDNDLSPAYQALANENDRLRRLLVRRGIEHQDGAIAHQYRQRPLWRGDDASGWMPWRECPADIAVFLTENPEDGKWQYEVRGLYPYSAAPVVYPTADELTRLILIYQANERMTVTGTINWAAAIGKLVVDKVKELNQ